MNVENKKRVDMLQNTLQTLIYGFLFVLLGYSVIDSFLTSEFGWEFLQSSVGWLDILLIYVGGVSLAIVFYESEKIKSNAERIANYINLFSVLGIFMIPLYLRFQIISEAYMFWSALWLLGTSWYGLLHASFFEEHVILARTNDVNFESHHKADIKAIVDAENQPVTKQAGTPVSQIKVEPQKEDRSQYSLKSEIAEMDVDQLLDAIRDTESVAAHNELEKRFKVLSQEEKDSVSDFLPNVVFNNLFGNANTRLASQNIRHKKFEQGQREAINLAFNQDQIHLDTPDDPSFLADQISSDEPPIDDDDNLNVNISDSLDE